MMATFAGVWLAVNFTIFNDKFIVNQPLTCLTLCTGYTVYQMESKLKTVFNLFKD